MPAGLEVARPRPGCASATCRRSRQRLVVADERPGQHGDRAGEHALDRLVGERLRVAGPRDGHRVRAGHVAVQDRRAHAARCRTTAPSRWRGRESVQLLGEVLHHVVALGLAVHQDVEADVVPAAAMTRSISAPHPLVVLAAVQPPGPQLGAGPPDRRRSAGTSRSWWWAGRAARAWPSATSGEAASGRRVNRAGPRRRRSAPGRGDRRWRPGARHSARRVAPSSGTSAPATARASATTSSTFSRANASSDRSSGSSAVSWSVVVAGRAAASRRCDTATAPARSRTSRQLPQGPVGVGPPDVAAVHHAGHHVHRPGQIDRSGTEPRTRSSARPSTPASTSTGSASPRSPK